MPARPTHGTVRSRWLPLAALVVAVSGGFGAGCASTGNRPADLDLRHARIVAMAAPPSLVVSGYSGGKSTGAAIGVGAGVGYGALAGAAACLATGPFLPLCLAVVLPTTTGVGAVTGGAVGAARAESAEAIEVKTQALSGALALDAYQEQLGREVEALRRASGGVDPGTGTEGDWIVEVGVTEVATRGSAEFSLRLVTTLRAHRPGSAMAWETRQEVTSVTELPLTQWLADDASALRGVLGDCIERAAQRLWADADRGFEPVRASTRRNDSSSCSDQPARRVRAAMQP